MAEKVRLEDRECPLSATLGLVDARSGTEAEPVVVDSTSGCRVDGPDFVFTAGPAESKPFRDRYQGRPGPVAPRSRRKGTASRGDVGDSRSEAIVGRVRRTP